MAALEQIVREEIRDQGPMRFDRYMTLALYHPEHGYYSAGRGIGKAGDFFTSVSVGPLFGRLLARQGAQMWHLLGNPKPFWIMEQGAHNGQLAFDMLEAMHLEDRELSEIVSYGIFEPSPAARKTQKELLLGLGTTKRVSWFRGLEEWNRDKPIGLFLSNELIDALPVRLIRRGKDQWKERHVRVAEDQSFCWEDLQICDSELQGAIDRLQLPKIDGYTTEINLAARKWIKELAGFLGRGYVLTVDYGFPASFYYAPFRIQGTLTTYREHHRHENVLLSPGESDMTAHVDFTALMKTGESGGLKTLGFIDQQRFLMGVAFHELNGSVTIPPAIQPNIRAWNTLTHPQHLGSRFQVLIQSKNAPDGVDGLRYCLQVGLD